MMTRSYNFRLVHKRATDAIQAALENKDLDTPGDFPLTTFYSASRISETTIRN